MSDLSVIYKIAGDITGLTSAVNRGAEATEQLSGKVSKAGTAILTSLTAAFSVAAISTAIHKYTEFTGALADMELKTGIGAEALQRLKYAAEQNGSSLEAVTGAVSKLGKNLAGDDKSAKGALDALGLSFKDIRNSAPDVAFAKIGDAISKIEDPMARSKLAMDLFGKSGAELLPVLTNHLSETEAEADKLGIVMSEDMVQAGDKFGDSMHSLELVGQSLIGRVLEPFVPMLTQLALWLGENIPKALGAAQGAFDWLIKKVMQIRLGFQEFVLGIVELGAKIPWLGERLGASADTVKALQEGVARSKDELAAFSTQTVTTTASVAAHSKTMQTLNLDYADNEKKTKESATATKKAQEAQDKWNESIRAANFQLEKWTHTIVATAPGLSNITKTFVEFGEVSDGVINNLGLDISHGLVGAVDLFGNAVDVDLLPHLDQVADRTFTVGQAQVAAQTTTKDLAEAFAQLAQIGNGTMSTITRGIGTMIASFNVAQTAIGSLKSGFGSLGKGDTLKGITDIAGGIGSIIGLATTAIAGVKALWNWAKGGEEGRIVNPERDQWFSGRSVQDVGDQLGAAGLGGEEARQMIQSVFDAKTDAQFKQASSAIDQLTKGGGRGVLPGEFGSEGVPVLGSGGILTQPQLAMVGDVPEAVIPLDRLASMMGGAGSAAQVVLMLDGRELARAMVPLLPGELRRLRLA